MTGPSPLHLRVLERNFVLIAPDASWQSLLSQLWEPFRCEAAAGDAVEIAVRSSGSEWQMAIDGSETASVPNAWLIADEVRHAIVETALENTPLLDLHAAAVVSADGTTALLAGPSGSGKTTMARLLSDSGWRVLSDDVALVDNRTHVVRPFPKPIALRDVDEWLRLATRWNPPAWPIEPRGALLAPAAVLPIDTGAADRRPDVVAFVRFTKDRSLRVRSLSVAETAARLSELMRRVDEATVRSLVDLARLVTRLDLQFGASADALAALEELVGHRSRV